jgi:hypothetical protein
MHHRAKAIFFLIFLLIGSVLNAQTTDSVLAAKINIWNKYANNRPLQLYLTLDKAIYMPNENINFSALLLYRGQDTVLNRTVYIVVVSLAKHKVVAADRFVMVNGISRGYVTIPDSVTKGEYLLMAYTNNFIGKGGNPPFCQQISIRSAKKTPFDLTVSVNQRNDSIALHCRVTTDYGGLAADGLMQYSISADSLELQAGKQKINAFGEVVITLPARDTLAKSLVLTAQVDRDKHSANFWLPLTLRPNQVAVNYYPEGGKLVDGRMTTIGVEIRKPNGMGIATKGILLEDGKDLVRFSTDEYGLGTIKTVVHAGTPYSVKLNDLAPGDYATGHFPDVLPNGFSLQVPAIDNPDTLHVTVQGPGPNSKFYIIVYNDQDILFNASVKLVAANHIGHLPLPTKDWPRGIVKIAIFDSAGQPMAERATFLTLPKIAVDIRTDSLLYHTRTTVSARIHVHDENGKGVEGIFSLSTLLTSRLGVGYPDITTTTKIDQFLSPDHVLLPTYYYDSTANTDLVMLTQFHPLPAWDDVMGDTSRLPDAHLSAEDFGGVRDMYNPGEEVKKKLKRPVALLVLGSLMYRLTSDSFGHFQIPYQALIMPIGKGNPIIAMVDKRDQEEYNLDIHNAYDTLNKRLAKIWYAPRRMIKDTTIHDEPDNGLSFNAVKSLKQVVIRAGDNDEYEDRHGGCQDYVCMYNVLNCQTPGHKVGSRKPVIGQDYTYRDAPGGHLIYRGCIDGGVSPMIGMLNAIHQPTQDHYYSDSTNLQSPDPITLSTLYWAPVVSTDKNGEAVITFFTNDLKGRFYLLVQGITNAGTFSGKQVIKVE